MRKNDIINNLEFMEKSLIELNKSIQKLKSTTVSSRNIQDIVKFISRKWFEELENQTIMKGVSEDIRNKYNLLFDKLLKLSLRTSWKNTYIKTIENILENFKDELLLQVLKSTGKIVNLSHLSKIFDNVTIEEKEYFTEAIGCANNNFFRASVILGWNAAVHRIHKIVEKLGFVEFNHKSEEMKNIKTGRFKRFNKSFNVHSISELRATVFDKDLLWILEYWGLIDANQHERLSICFTMRNNCAHPGEAPLTEENLASFYSDLKNIVFDNPKLKL